MKKILSMILSLSLLISGLSITSFAESSNTFTTKEIPGTYILQFKHLAATVVIDNKYVQFYNVVDPLSKNPKFEKVEPKSKWSLSKDKKYLKMPLKLSEYTVDYYLYKKGNTLKCLIVDEMEEIEGVKVYKSKDLKTVFNLGIKDKNLKNIYKEEDDFNKERKAQEEFVKKNEAIIKKERDNGILFSNNNQLYGVFLTEDEKQTYTEIAFVWDGNGNINQSGGTQVSIYNRQTNKGYVIPEAKITYQKLSDKFQVTINGPLYTSENERLNKDVEIKLIVTSESIIGIHSKSFDGEDKDWFNQDSVMFNR